MYYYITVLAVNDFIAGIMDYPFLLQNVLVDQPAWLPSFCSDYASLACSIFTFRASSIILKTPPHC